MLQEKANFVLMTVPPDKEFIVAVQRDWTIQLNESATEEQLLHALAGRVNHLIQYNFSILLSLLYRIDISEQKLRQLLHGNPKADAGIFIAHLILERQKQKVKTREQFSRRDDNINDDEKW